MNVNFTSLQRSDVIQAARIWYDAWHEAHAHLVPAELTKLRTEDNFAYRLEEHLAQTIAAKSHGHVLGFAITREDELYQLYVSQEARGTGAASALMQASEAQIASDGYRTGWLDCAIGNGRARRFYEKSCWHLKREEITNLDTSQGPFPLKVWRFEKSIA